MDQRYLPHKVQCTRQDEHILRLESGYELSDIAPNTGHWLKHWSQVAPERVFIAERSGEDWRRESYLEVFEKVRAIASSLVGRGLNAETPILILSGNGVDHGILTLAAQFVGIPTVPVAEQYSLIPEAAPRLEHVIELVKPGMVFAADAERFTAALALESLKGAEAVAAETGQQNATDLKELLNGDSSVDLDEAHAKVGPDTMAKILMTSGSTSMPKGVITTQRMMCVNQAQIAASLPFLTERPPRILDWLPWNHVFGGSHNFNMMLANGGSLFIDDGKPLKGLFERSLENLATAPGTLSFNVPVGFAMLLNALRDDADLRKKYFQDLDLIFYAGASLPQEVWKGLEELALKETGKLPLLTSSWGLTETSPGCALQHQPPESSGVIGVPLPGVTAKLIADGTGRYEIRVKGPNITPGYYKQPDKTAAAFDDEGYFITGDAVRFVDDADPNAGLRFDGRTSEDFKLLTGTWVRASALRLDVLSKLAPLCTDVTITGHDKDEIGLFIFPNREFLAGLNIKYEDDGSILTGEELSQEVIRRIVEHNETHSASSTRIGRALVLSEMPSLAEGEITAKGNLNFNQILARRSELLKRLYDDADPAVIRVKE